jgi:acyl carrier protein/NADP-dependent 3-hydroxy acid dehydrogenase YdfG
MKALGVPFIPPVRQWPQGAGPLPPRTRTTVTLGAHGVVSATSRRLQSRLAASTPPVKRTRAVAAPPATLPAPVVTAAVSSPIVSGGMAALSDIAGPAHLVQPLQSQVADNHREFLGGQMAIARALLSGTPVDASVLGVLRDLQDKGAQLHEQYLRDQSEIAGRMLGASPTPSAGVRAREFEPAVLTVPSRGPVPTIAAQPVVATALPQPPRVATPVPAVPPPAAIPVSVPVSVSVPGAVLARLLEIVAEATGYPVDFIEPDMDLEGDLGIDSIKRMQIFATFQGDRPDAPVKALAGARTLAAIVAVLEQNAEPSAAAAPAAASPAAASRAVIGTPDAAVVYAALLRIVADKTGYPEDVLQPDMDLEADLGIDSVKRMEILAAASEHLGIMRERGGAQPRAAGTLTGMAEMLHHALAGDAAPAAPAPASRAEPAPESHALASGIAQVGLVDQPAIETAGSWLSGRVVMVVHDGGGETEATVSALVQSGAVPVTLDLWPGVAALDVDSDDRHHLVLTDASDAAMAATFTRIGAMLGPVQGVVMLLPVPPDSAASHAVLARGLDLLRAAGPVLEKAGGRLLAVTRLDGALGLERVGLPQSDVGGVAGAVKSAAREWPATTVAMLDIDPASALPEVIVTELSHMTSATDGTIPEVAVAPGCRRVLRLAAAKLGERAAFGEDELVLVTGGGRGVTALCAQALARQTGARIVLMGRTPQDPTEPVWADGVVAAELRKAAGAWLREAGQTATPREIEALCHRVLALRDLRANQVLLQDRVPAIGYVSADLSDGEAVAQAVAGIVAESGPITAIVHGAGGLADRRIADIKPGDFASVFGPKVDGFSHVLAAVDSASLRRIALFSSTAAYFGNAGQAIYAMANEILNKRAYALAAALPSARVVSLGWGPWDGGMVTPDLAERFRARGVGLLSAEAGTTAFLDLFLQPETGAHQFVIGDPPGSPHAARAAGVAGVLV